MIEFRPSGTDKMHLISTKSEIRKLMNIKIVNINPIGRETAYVSSKGNMIGMLKGSKYLMNKLIKS